MARTYNSNIQRIAPAPEVLAEIERLRAVVAWRAENSESGDASGCAEALRLRQLLELTEEVKDNGS